MVREYKTFSRVQDTCNSCVNGRSFFQYHIFIFRGRKVKVFKVDSL